MNGLELKAVQGAAGKLVSPSNLVWIVVGDRAKIEPRMRELGLTKIIAVDGDGQAEGSGTK
ncbi:MAG: zinc protease [Rhodothermales bacterium]|jgi:zinc protease